MPKRRTSLVWTTGGPVIPLELLGHGLAAFRGRHQWFIAHGLRTWQEKYEAIGRSYEAHGLPSRSRDPDEPDPRDLLQGLVNDSPAIPPRRRRT